MSATDRYVLADALDDDTGIALDNALRTEFVSLTALDVLAESKGT